MDIIGKIFKWVLSINTIWGLMILVSLVAAVSQHYLPTTTWIPNEFMTAGQKTAEIRIIDRNDELHTAQFSLTVSGGSMELGQIPERPQEEDDPTPWVVRTAEKAGKQGIVWDAQTYGNYQFFIDGTLAARGRLVTLGTFTDAAFNYAQIAFELGLGFVSTFVLFLGLMKVGEDAGIVQIVARVLRPLINFLFPGIPKGHPASGAIVMNITTAILGLGNASTPFGLKAMEELQKLNPRKDTATDAMCMLLGYNTAGFALLPTTMLALRKSAGASDPYAIIGTCMIAGATSTIVAMLMVKLLSPLPMFKVEYTPQELASVAEDIEAEARQRAEEAEKEEK